MLTERRSRSFKKGTESLYRSKGCNIVVCLTFRMIPESGTQTQAACMWFNSDQVAGFFLTACRFAVLKPKKIQNTSFERSKSFLLVKSLIKRVAAFLRLVLPYQSDPISIVFISRGLIFIF